MSIVRLDKVSKSFSGEPVFVDVDLRIEVGERIGLIGRNGTGKSTIFRIITGEMEPDSGLVDRMKRARFAALAQIPRISPDLSIFDVVLHSFDDVIAQEKQLAELEERMAAGEDVLEEYARVQDAFIARGGYEFRTRIKQVLHGLGFSLADFELPFKALSGGQRTRLMLALVLLQDADLLLLDEPENHLDLEAREWLETYLQSCKATVFIISHDRRTLNHVATRILDLERGEIRSYTGNYETYLRQKALVREQQLREFENQQERIRKEQVFIEKFRYKATKARQVQSRVKRLDKMELVEAPESEVSAVSFGLGEVTRSGAVVLDAKNLSMGYDGLSLYSNVSFQVHRGERVGIIGPNGAGKSTLLRQLAMQHNGLGGEIVLGNKVKLGYYDQNHDDLNPDADVLTEVHAARPAWKPEQIRSFLGRFLFTGDDVFKTIRTLSGGETARVAMARLILGEANVLLLDEPTNHLDIVSREALEQALQEFPGTLILISHDREMIDRLCDKLVILENGATSVFLGNYTQYIEKKAREARAEEIADKKTEDVLRIRRGKEKEKQKAQKQKPDVVNERKRQKEQEALEKKIEDLEQVVREFEEGFAHISPTDYTILEAHTKQYEAHKAELQALYEQWEAVVQ